MQSGYPTILLYCEEKTGTDFQRCGIEGAKPLSEEIVIPLEQWLERHKLYQAAFYDDVDKTESESFVIQSCLTLCNPTDCSPPGSSAHRFLQARILELVAIPFSRASSQPKDQTWVFSLQADSLPFETPGVHVQIIFLCPTCVHAHT